VVLATPYAANAAPITSAGDLPGKILIDVTNPIGADFTLAWSLPAQAPKKQQNWHRARGFKRECIKWVSRSWPTLPSRLGSP
jgi:hypothetical protein